MGTQLDNKNPKTRLATLQMKCLTRMTETRGSRKAASEDENGDGDGNVVRVGVGADVGVGVGVTTGSEPCN